MESIAPPLFQLPLAASPSSSSSSSYSIPTLPIFSKQHHFPLSLHCHHRFRRTTRSPVVVLVGSNEETTTQEDEQLEYEEPDPQDLEYVRQIKRVSFFYSFLSMFFFFFSALLRVYFNLLLLFSLCACRCWSFSEKIET
jgi:hypothetical protein